MRKPHGELRVEALKIAEEIVVGEGLAALTARRVAGETGCSVGTLYNVFGQLDGLIDEGWQGEGGIDLLITGFSGLDAMRASG